MAIVIGHGIGIPWMCRGGLLEYIDLTDGDCIWRVGARSGELVWDHTLTATGFDGTEDIDWYNPQSES